MIISLNACVDELNKIAEAVSATQDRFITPERLKRALISATIIGAGTGVGAGLGKMLERRLMNSRLAGHPTVRKYGPAAAGMLAGLGTAVVRTRDRKASQYIAHGPKKEQ